MLLTIQSIGKLVHQITDPLFQKKPHMALMAHWTLIAGPDLARTTWPLKVTSTHGAQATLYVCVQPAHALNVWAHSVVLTERVNRFFGHAAIGRIRFVKKSFAVPGVSIPIVQK